MPERAAGCALGQRAYGKRKCARVFPHTPYRAAALKLCDTIIHHQIVGLCRRHSEAPRIELKDCGLV